MQLDKEDDVNKVLKYFSYEHFYVIYCKVRLTLSRRQNSFTANTCMPDFPLQHLCAYNAQPYRHVSQFWELDADHDFLICKEDLLRYGNHSLTYRIVDRIFSQVTLC